MNSPFSCYFLDLGITFKDVQRFEERNKAPTTLKSEGEVTSLSGADKREVRDNREKW
jgi:hypothetical protein